MSGIDLLAVVPGTSEAWGRGCICPDQDMPLADAAVIFSGFGFHFNCDCPVHRQAILVEVQRLMGAGQ
jgi:hypothetical protein